MIIAAIMAVVGTVRIQVKRILYIVPHAIPKKLRDKPTPTIEPVTVCVVETGTPRSVAAKMTAAAAASAQHPRNVFKCVIFLPIVCTIRHPPESVPRAMTK